MSPNLLPIRAIRLLVSSSLLITMGCSDGEGGFEKPSINLEDKGSLTLTFSNLTQDEIFVDWIDDRPAFVLEKGSVNLKTRKSCTPLCADGCICSACTSGLAKVRRVSVGETIQLDWVPIHFVESACSGSPDCRCFESWSITAGHYRLSLAGFTDGQGGQMVGTPEVLSGVEPGAESKKCSASIEFEYGPKTSKLEAQLLCSN